MGFVTFMSFLMLGFIPLIIYVVDYLSPLDSDLFLISSVLTGCCFLGIGLLKSLVTSTSKIRSVIETLLLGGAAATLSYFVGSILEQIINN